MVSPGMYPPKDRLYEVQPWLITMILCILGLVTLKYFLLQPDDNIIANTSTVTAQDLQLLKAGDFVELQSGQILVVPKVPKSDQFLIMLAEANYKPEQRGIEITARQTKRIVKTTDPDWPKTARKFLTPNQPQPEKQPN